MIGHGARATYLLSDGLEARGSQPWCYHHRHPQPTTRTLPIEQHDGLWAQVPSEAPEDETGFRVVGWLSPHGVAIHRYAGTLHEFRDVVLAKYPSARFMENHFYANGVVETPVRIDDSE